MIDRAAPQSSLRPKLLAAAHARLAAARNLEEIIAVVRSMVRALTEADGVTFVLNDNGYCHYVEEDAIRPLWKGRKFPMTSCISGWAMMNGQTAVIPDIFADARIPHDVYRQTFVKSLVMTPVGLDVPVAAIGVYWREKPMIGNDEVALIETIAAMVGDAFQRTRAAA